MEFIILDLTLLVICTCFAFYFARKHKDKMHKEGWMYLYKTSFGIKIIDQIAKKYRTFLLPLQYVIITSGYLLMSGMIYLLIKTLVIYLAQSSDAPLAKVPAVFPLIPYFPELFNLDSVFPPFYFFYFIVAIAIVAIVHEAAHGIIARLNNVRIKTTGIAFLGPFLGAFVEQDDKQMNKASTKAQLAILAAGTFANVIMSLLFGLLLILFFTLAFQPTGFIFDQYAFSVLNTSDITSVTNASIPGYLALTVGNTTKFVSASVSEYATPGILVYAYDDAPAFRAQLSRTILSINNQQMNSYEMLSTTLAQAKPGETITILGLTPEETEETKTLVLEERNGKAYLGIASIPYQSKGILGSWYNMVSLVKSPSLYYTSSFSGAQFIYDLLWWVVIINMLVALFNMFPAGMLDGGRFLYLTVLGLTNSKKLAHHSFAFCTYLLYGVVIVMMLKWTWVIIT